jgi:hypothetical protein
MLTMPMRCWRIAKDAKAIIPTKMNQNTQRTFDPHQYRNSNVIERFFAKLKQF